MKKKSDASYLTRRNFLGKTACSTMAMTGVVNTLAHLKLMQSSLAQGGGSSDYKALVVLFLFGGNDSNNTLIPRLGHPEYDNYLAGRGVLGIADENDPNYDPAGANAGSSIALNGTADPYGVHPNMQPLADLFNTGELSFVSNVGTLSFPVSRADYLDSSKKYLLPHSCSVTRISRFSGRALCLINRFGLDGEVDQPTCSWEAAVAVQYHCLSLWPGSTRCRWEPRPRSMR